MIFNLSKKTTIAVLVFIAVFAAFLIFGKAHAAPLDAPYVQLGAGAAIVRGTAPVIDLTFTEPASVLQHAYWQESLTIIGTSTYNGQPAPNNFAVRGLFVDGIGRFDVGLGLSWMQNPAPYNGSPVNANLQLAYRFGLGVTLTYSHISNAGTRLPNLGRDVILIGWRFH